ncbi:hypothetical protein [Thermomonas brevis]
MQEGIAATPRVLTVLAQAPNLESNETAQAMLADVIAVSLDGCERGELAEVISVFADCPPPIAKMALTLLTAAFFPDGKIVPTEFDDSAILCFLLLVAVAGKPFEALDMIRVTANERKGERFAANADLLRASIEEKYGRLPATVLPDAPKSSPAAASGAASLNLLDYALKAAAVKRTQRKRRRVVFLINQPQTFSALEPVITELQKRADRFEPVIVAIPLSTAKIHGPEHSLQQTCAFLRERGFNPITLTGQGTDDLIRLIRLAPDFIFRQQPWEGTVPAVFRSPQLGFAQLCYIPYGMMTVDWPQKQCNQPFHNDCDLLFAESPYHFERYAQYRQMGTQGVVMSGYPRYEQFVRQLEAEPAPWPLAAPEAMPRVIWAPHLSVPGEPLSYSTFLEYKDVMLAEAKRGRMSILFRPHPGLGDRLVGKGHMSREDWAAYQAAWDATGTSGVDHSPGYIEQFSASDLLITDGIGFFSEYLLTGKPLVRTWKPSAEPLNAFGDWCVACARVAVDEAALKDVLDEVGEHRYQDKLLQMRLERRESLIEMCQGAAARVADALESN